MRLGWGTGHGHLSQQSARGGASRPNCAARLVLSAIPPKALDRNIPLATRCQVRLCSSSKAVDAERTTSHFINYYDVEFLAGREPGVDGVNCGACGEPCVGSHSGGLTHRSCAPTAQMTITRRTHSPVGTGGYRGGCH